MRVVSSIAIMDSPLSPSSEHGYPSPSHKRVTSSDELYETANKGITNIRFLISNAAAGSVIGKGGSTINEFQFQSGARIQLSRNYECFPGTTDRIIELSGTIIEVLTAFHLIVSKIYNEVEIDDEHVIKTYQVKLVVPNNVCGAIIGKGGATVKAFSEDSQANIKLSSQQQAIPGLNDRIITITGTLEQQLRAVALIIKKLSEDSNYVQYATAPLSYAGTGMSFPCFVTPCGVAPYGPKAVLAPMVAVTAAHFSVPIVPAGSVTIDVPDEHVGAIVGRGGKTISDIQQMSGARIKISGRGDFVAGTNNRKVTITGSAEGMQIAQQLLTQRVQQSYVSDFEEWSPLKNSSN